MVAVQAAFADATEKQVLMVNLHQCVVTTDGVTHSLIQYLITWGVGGLNPVQP